MTVGGNHPGTRQRDSTLRSPLFREVAILLLLACATTTLNTHHQNPGNQSDGPPWKESCADLELAWPRLQETEELFLFEREGEQHPQAIACEGHS